MSPSSRHVLRIDLEIGIGEAVDDEVVVLVEEPVLPVDVGTAVVDEELVVVPLRRLARRLQPAPGASAEQGLAVLAAVPVNLPSV